MRAGKFPRFSRLTMYAPPPDGYAMIVWRYERTTIVNNAITMRAIGRRGRKAIAPAPAPSSSTATISSVAYAVDEIASDAKTGSAIFLLKRWCCSSALEIGFPRRIFLSVAIGCLSALPTLPTLRPPIRFVNGFLAPKNRSVVTLITAHVCQAASTDSPVQVLCGSTEVDQGLAQVSGVYEPYELVSSSFHARTGGPKLFGAALCL